MKPMKVAALISALLISACSNANDSTQKSEAEATQEREQRKMELFDLVTNEEASTKYRLDTAKTLISEFPESAEAMQVESIVPELEREHAMIMESISYKWEYRSNEDPMSSKKFLIAGVYSSNHFEFDFPYQGRQKARLIIRNHPRYGRDVMFSIRDGQIICSSYSCPIVVRFDNEDPIYVTGSEPVDSSSEMVFLPMYDTMMRKLPDATTLRVQFEVFHQGVYFAEFDVRGFKPEKMN